VPANDRPTVSELPADGDAGLHWSDVDLEAGILKITTNRVRPHYEHGCSTPCGMTPGHCTRRVQTNEDDGPSKSHAGKRKIGLPPQLVQLLEDHHREQDQERAKAGQLWVETGRVFTDRFSRAVQPNSNYHAWKSLLKRAGVRETRLHDARRCNCALGPGGTGTHSYGCDGLVVDVDGRALAARNRSDPARGCEPSRRAPLFPAGKRLRLKLRPYPQNRRLDCEVRRRFPLLTSGGGCGIRTREGVNPTRFPSERHRPLGESSARKVTGNPKHGRTPPPLARSIGRGSSRAH
jgi:hypothetical protein